MNAAEFLPVAPSLAVVRCGWMPPLATVCPLPGQRRDFRLACDAAEALTYGTLLVFRRRR